MRTILACKTACIRKHMSLNNVSQGGNAVRIMYRYSKNVNKTYPNRLYESQFPGEQDAPLGFWGNDFGGNINHPVLIDYTVVGYTNDRLWLQSKTGGSSDAIIIGFSVDPHNFDRVWAGKKASFAATFEWDHLAEGWYYQWRCIKAPR